MREVVAYYHETLKASPVARAYLRKRGIDDDEAIERFQLGYADRSLGLRLPNMQRKAGAEIRSKLQRLRIIRESGHGAQIIASLPAIHPQDLTSIDDRDRGRPINMTRLGEALTDDSVFAAGTYQKGEE
jgi:hypothetical protein